MKLAPRTYQAWWALHAWAGVASSLVLYVIMFFGAWTVFDGPLQIWQEPRGPVPTLAQVDRALDRHLADKAIDPASLRIHLPRASDPGFGISCTDGAGQGADRRIEPDGSLTEPRTAVAGFLYAMHYLQFPSAPGWLYLVAGAAAATLLLVVVTGLLIHLRGLARQLHRFRPRRRLRVVWSDAHKVLGTIGLPFAIVYAFTGAWMALDSVVQPRVVATGFAGSEAAATRARDGPPAPGSDLPEAKQPAARLPLATLLAIARRTPVGGLPPAADRRCRGVYYLHTGDANATALFLCSDADIVLRQRDGHAFAAPALGSSLFQRLGQVPNELHFIERAATPLRVIWVVLALACCLTIATGNWIWLARRRASRANAVIRRLTIAVAAGSAIATGAMLLGNRLGVTLAYERPVFWLAWLGATLAAFAIREPRSAWWIELGVAGALLLAAPVVGMVTMDGGLARWPAGLDVSRAVDVGLAITGTATLALARVLRRFAGVTGVEPVDDQRGRDDG